MSFGIQMVKLIVLSLVTESDFGQEMEIVLQIVTKLNFQKPFVMVIEFGLG